METKTIVLTTDELEYLTSMLISREKEIDTFLRMFPMNSDLVTLRENHFKFVGKILNDPKPTVEEDGRPVAFVVEEVESWFEYDQWSHESTVVAVCNTQAEAEKFIETHLTTYMGPFRRVQAKINKIKMD